jgi:hypothetical protein
MRLIPGKLYRTKKELRITFSDEPRYSYSIPEGVLLMFVEQKIMPYYTCTLWKTYHFLLGEEKIIFWKGSQNSLESCFQSTEDWEM